MFVHNSAEYKNSARTSDSLCVVLVVLLSGFIYQKLALCIFTTDRFQLTGRRRFFHAGKSSSCSAFTFSRMPDWIALFKFASCSSYTGRDDLFYRLLLNIQQQ